MYTTGSSHRLRIMLAAAVLVFAGWAVWCAPAAVGQETGKEAVRPAQPVQAQAERGPRWPEGTEVFRDLEYVPGGHERQKLDIYVPPAAEGALPLIVWVHGGA